MTLCLVKNLKRSSKIGRPLKGRVVRCQLLVEYYTQRKLYIARFDLW